MLVWLIVPFMIFAVFDPSPLTVCKLQFFYIICKEESPRQTGKTSSKVSYQQCSLRTSPLKAFQLQMLSYDADNE